MERFAYGAFGAVLPDIVLFESKRFVAPLLTFNTEQYVIVTLFYMLAAGVVARVYPYRGAPTAWKALVVGVTLPLIVSGLTSVVDRASKPSTEQTAVRGPPPSGGPADVSIPGTVVDLMALF